MSPDSVGKRDQDEWNHTKTHNEVPSIPNKSSNIAFITKRYVPYDIANTKQWQYASFP
jgi:hypothetical protein